MVFAVGLDLEMRGERVDRLGAYAVKADALLESLTVVLGARVDFGYAVDHLAEWDATAEVAHRDVVVVDDDVDPLAVAAGMLVNRVVDDLLEKNVDPVVRRGAVAELSDVHSGAESDVLAGTERLDAGFGVVRFCHLGAIG